MVEQRRYDVVFAALQLACKKLEKANMSVTKDNIDMLEHGIHGSLVGYFLMKAESLLDTSIHLGGK